MMRALQMATAFLALSAFVAGPSLFAADKGNTHSGTVVSSSDTELVMTDKNGKEHSHKVGTDVKVTCDGKKCKLTDLKKGQKIKVTMEDEKVVKIEAEKEQ